VPKTQSNTTIIQRDQNNDNSVHINIITLGSQVIPLDDLRIKEIIKQLPLEVQTKIFAQPLCESSARAFEHLCCNPEDPSMHNVFQPNVNRNVVQYVDSEGLKTADLAEGIFDINDKLMSNMQSATEETLEERAASLPPAVRKILEHFDNCSMGLDAMDLDNKEKRILISAFKRRLYGDRSRAAKRPVYKAATAAAAVPSLGPGACT
jgi:hypothetical protein